MRARIIVTLTALIAATGLAAAATPASARSLGYPSGCTNVIADINETFGAYGVGAQNHGDVGDLGVEVVKPGWDVCTFQHPDGSWNLYLYNGNELASRDSCIGGTGAIVVKSAGSAGTAWTLGGYGPGHYTWHNTRCGAYLAGTDFNQALALCDNSGGTYDCTNGYYKSWTLDYNT